MICSVKLELLRCPVHRIALRAACSLERSQYCKVQESVWNPSAGGRIWRDLARAGGWDWRWGDCFGRVLFNRANDPWAHTVMVWKIIPPLTPSRRWMIPWSPGICGASPSKNGLQLCLKNPESMLMLLALLQGNWKTFCAKKGRLNTEICTCVYLNICVHACYLHVAQISTFAFSCSIISDHNV